MPYKGYNFEDGVVISDKLVKENKLTSLHLIEEEIEVEETDRITFFYNKIGPYLNKGEHLVRKSVGEIEKLIGLDIDEDIEEFLGGQYIKKCPGGKIRSHGRGRGLGIGNKKGPLNKRFSRKIKTEP
jgi:hypothetical protein